tara:strand:- start:4402 stop:4596 length:195 start_codon:yes stop_codon:yes gene_type:complete
MNENEIQELCNIRAYLITRYKNLDGRTNQATAVMLQKDVAFILENTIKRIDGVLTNYVNIEKNK